MPTLMVMSWCLAAAVLLCAAPAGSRHQVRTSAAPLASALGVYSEGVPGVFQQLRGGGRSGGSSEKKTKKHREKKRTRDAADGKGKEQEVKVMHGRVEKREGKGAEQPSGKQGNGVKSKGGGLWQYDSEEVGEEASSDSVMIGEGSLVNDPRTVRQDNKWRERRLREAGLEPKTGTDAQQSVRPQLGARPAENASHP